MCAQYCLQLTQWKCSVIKCIKSYSVCSHFSFVLLVHNAGVKVSLLCRSGEVTQKMLDAPDKRLFIGIGGLEAASQLLGFVGASKLPGRLAHLLQLTLIITATHLSLCYFVSVFLLLERPPFPQQCVAHYT